MLVLKSNYSSNLINFNLEHKIYRIPCKFLSVSLQLCVDCQYYISHAALRMSCSAHFLSCLRCSTGIWLTKALKRVMKDLLGLIFHHLLHLPYLQVLSPRASLYPSHTAHLSFTPAFWQQPCFGILMLRNCAISTLQCQMW